MKDWKINARELGHICPDCKQPVAEWDWKRMNKVDGTTLYCWSCRYAHWEVPLNHAGGSARRDNQDRDGWNNIRSQG